MPLRAEQHTAGARSHELERMGIDVVRLGSQYRVITATVWAFLGLMGGASPAPSAHAAAGQRGPAAHGVRFLAPVRAVDGD